MGAGTSLDHFVENAKSTCGSQKKKHSKLKGPSVTQFALASTVQQSQTDAGDVEGSPGAAAEIDPVPLRGIVPVGEVAGEHVAPLRMTTSFIKRKDGTQVLAPAPSGILVSKAGLGDLNSLPDSHYNALQSSDGYEHSKSGTEEPSANPTVKESPSSELKMKPAESAQYQAWPVAVEEGEVVPQKVRRRKGAGDKRTVKCTDANDPIPLAVKPCFVLGTEDEVLREVPPETLILPPSEPTETPPGAVGTRVRRRVLPAKKKEITENSVGGSNVPVATLHEGKSAGKPDKNPLVEDAFEFDW